MKRKIKMTPEQLEKLISNILSTDAHLDNEKIVGYMMNRLSAEDVKQIESHLENCYECATIIEQLHQVSSAWEGETGAERLAKLRERTLHGVPRETNLLAEALQQLQLNWQKVLGGSKQFIPKFANTEESRDRKLMDDEVEIGNLQLKFHAVLGKDNSLTFRFSSPNLDYRGARFMLSMETFTQEVVLRRVSKEEIGAKVMIPDHLRPNNLENFSLEIL